MNGIIIATVLIAGIGLFIGVFLGIAGEKFKVEVDEKEIAVLAALPGNNCGSCGYPGCEGLAKAITEGIAPVNACPVGGTNTAEEVAKIMGKEVVVTKPMTAFVKCAGTCEHATENYKYMGEKDCSIMRFVPDGGPKACNYGCLGGGTCQKVCQFGAISILNGIAVVDSKRCIACGACVKACPKELIEMVPKASWYRVQCASEEKGQVVNKQCKVGCIACGICVKECKEDAICVENNIAHIDYDKCINCGACQQKCPKKTITKS